MITIESTARGKCSLSGKECDGVNVTFADGSLKNVFLSWRSLQQLAKLKSKQTVTPSQSK